MSNLKWACALTVLLSALGAVADAQIGGPGTCNNKCRLRTGHYYTGSGPCVEWAYPTCTLCVNNNLCTDAGTSLGTNCISTEQQNMIKYYSTCTTLCDTAGVSAVEATMTSESTRFNSLTRDICW